MCVWMFYKTLIFKPFLKITIMAYGSFRRITKVVSTFGLKVEQADLFAVGFRAIEPSIWLQKTLDKSRDVGFVNEKERSERVVYPILSEVAGENGNQITIYSGRDLDVDASVGLNGECDFLMSLGQKPLVLIDTPIFSVVEAKKEDMQYGLAQCAAQMIGVQRYNKRQGKEISAIYGVVTDANHWMFLKLEDFTLQIHKRTFNIFEIDIILGAFQCAFEDCRRAELSILH